MEPRTLPCSRKGQRGPLCGKWKHFCLEFHREHTLQPGLETPGSLVTKRLSRLVGNQHLLQAGPAGPAPGPPGLQFLL